MIMLTLQESHHRAHAFSCKYYNEANAHYSNAPVMHKDTGHTKPASCSFVVNVKRA